jgi:hypothetical protein
MLNQILDKANILDIFSATCYKRRTIVIMKKELYFYKGGDTVQTYLPRRPLKYIQYNLSKLNLLATRLCTRNRQVFGLYRVN